MVAQERINVEKHQEHKTTVISISFQSILFEITKKHIFLLKTLKKADRSFKDDSEIMRDEY